MKRVLSLILAAGLALSLSACGDVLVDLDTPKSSELSAQYDFYPDSMNTIRADMQITPEQADDVFIALVSCGLDGKISTVSFNVIGTISSIPRLPFQFHGKNQAVAL